jgi:ATP-dependent DNA helicase Rep
MPRVFLVGVDDTTLPHEGSIEEGRIEEERRLLYVGITRAKEQLSLSYAKRRKRFGEIIANQPSRFLAELPADDLHWSGRDAEQDAAHRQELASSHIARLASLLAD